MGHHNHHREQIELIRKLAAEGERFVNPADGKVITEINYLIECSRLVHQYFLNAYSDKFIFSSFSYLNERNEFASVPYLFYGEKKSDEINATNYWKTVSWDTNIPDKAFGLSNESSNIIDKNYQAKNIGFVKELIWYLINQLIAEERILAVTELLLHYNKMDPRNFLICSCEEGGVNINSLKERFLTINLKSFDLPQVKSTREFEDVKAYKNISTDVLDILRSEYEYDELTKTTDNSRPVLTEDRIKSFAKLLNIYRQICYCKSDDNYFFYFLRPITFYEEFRGVFLLGLNKLLSAEEIIFIENINYRILSDVVLSRIRQLTALKENAEATSHFGHLLRYRLSPPGQYIELLGKEITSLKKLLPKENKAILDSIERYQKSASMWLSKTEKTGFLLNIKAHYFENPDSGYKVFDERDIWRNKSAFNLLLNFQNLIKEINENRIQIHTTRKFQHFNLIEGCSKILIDKWFPFADPEYRPFDILYEDMLFEILINAFKASPTGQDIEIKVYQEKIKASVALIIANKIDENILRKNTRLYQSIKENWKAFKDFSGSIGGLSYWSQLIDVTDAGKVFIRTVEVGDSTYFETGLLLRGLKF